MVKSDRRLVSSLLVCFLWFHAACVPAKDFSVKISSLLFFHMTLVHIQLYY